MDELLPRLTLAGVSVRGREDMHGHIFSTLLLTSYRWATIRVQHRYNRVITSFSWVYNHVYTSFRLGSRQVHQSGIYILTAPNLHHYDGIYTHQVQVG